MVVKGKIVHLLKIVLAGKIYFQNCPSALSHKRYASFYKTAKNLTTQNKHTDLKASELIKYRALVLATLDYYIENFSGGEYFKSLKLQTEEHFKKGRLTILKQWFRDCTEQQVETLDFKFNDYLQNKTGYKLDIFQDYYERVDKILTKGKISTENQFYDISSMVDKLCQTEPIDTVKINNLNLLLSGFEKRKTKARRNKNDAQQTL